MKRHTFLLTSITLFGLLFLAGCADVTQQPASTSNSQSDPIATQEAEPTIAVNTATLEPSPLPVDTPTETFSPAATPIAPIPINVADGDGLNHEVVFTIRNEGRYSGEGNQAAWLGWGADNLAVSPDGSFWLADTPADPDRLLHYNLKGELLKVIPMHFGDRAYWARDIAASSSGVWVLDYISQPPVVLQLSQDGSLLANYTIPEQFATHTQEGNVMPGLWHIPFIDGDAIYLDGPVGIVAMAVKDGNASFQQVSGYTLGGRVYTEVEHGLMVNNLRVGMKLLQPDHFLNSAWLLGITSDGSFYVRVDESNNDQGKSEPPDQFVRRYSSTGDLLGIALLPLPELDQIQDVTMGPDGNVYALYSRTNHSVEVLRLRFASGVAPLLSPITVYLQPAFKPLLPSGTIPVTDQDAAREAMLTFFSDLAARHYDEAVNLFGGSYEIYKTMDESISADQPAMAWQNICQMEFCLDVSDILDSRQVAADEYEFLVGFVTDNGIRFDYSICCGNFQPTPIVTWFVYSVKVQKINEQWLVMGGALPLP